MGVARLSLALVGTSARMVVSFASESLELADEEENLERVDGKPNYGCNFTY